METERLSGDPGRLMNAGRCYNGEVLVRWNSRQSLKSTEIIRRKRRFKSQVRQVEHNDAHIMLDKTDNHAVH